jgi:UDP-galactopyranose mutase
VPNKKNLDLYEKYRELANKESNKNIFFIGRLANYKYFNMDEAILNSLEFFDSHFG